jgi:hypothetical protein
MEPMELTPTTLTATAVTLPPGRLRAPDHG